MVVSDSDAGARPDGSGLTFETVAVALANDYESIYVIDCSDDSYVEYGTYGADKKLARRGDGSDFYWDAVVNCRRLVYQDDQQSFIKHMRKENLLGALADGRAFTHEYRLVIDGEPVYFFLKAIMDDRFGSGHIIIGVRNIDDQMRRIDAAEAERRTYSEIAESLASLYEVIYYIDPVTGSYSEYSSSQKYEKLGLEKGGRNFFERAKEDIKRIVYPEDLPRLSEELKKEKLLENLRSAGSVSITYRQYLDGVQQYVRLLGFMQESSGRIVIAVRNVDAVVRRELAMKEESSTFAEIVRALASRYEVIYYVNIITDEYVEYSSSEKYARLKVGARGADFFGDTQRNMRRDIYYEDYPKMSEAMQKDNLLSSLGSLEKINLNYRLILDDRPQYVTLFAIRPKEDSDHIIVAVANIDAEVRREIAYEEALGSAIDMASRDALTGVKNKHAYVQAEIEMDNMIKEGVSPDFAVVICDVNGLKGVNDMKGHSAGDEYIKSACNIICGNFKHSPVFRIGGDEFAVLLKGQDYENRDSLMDKLWLIMIENKNSGLVTVAGGISGFKRGQDIRMQDVFERADQAMYVNKQHLKAI